MRTWLTALRIARREARKAKGRSMLVVAMIGLPVAFLTSAAVSYDMFQLTPQERIDRQMGNADALIRWYSTTPVEQSPDGLSSWASSGSDPGSAEETAIRGEAELLAQLPAGTKVLPIEQRSLKVRTLDGIANASVRFENIADPLMTGIVAILEGTAPATVGQIALNAAAARWLKAGIGDVVKTVDPDRSFTVTGIIEYPDSLAPVLVAQPAARPSSAEPPQNWLIDTPSPVGWEQIKTLNKSGMVVLSREVILDPPPFETAFDHQAIQTEEIALGTVVAGLAVLEIILLAGPAFAVGARRRTRDLALVAASGGEPKQLRRIVLADGVVLGLAGAVAGLVLGVALAVAGRPFIEEYLAQARAGGYRFFILALIGIAGLAVGTGVLAATVPAFTAARQPVVQALTGRRGITKSRKRWLFLGLGMATIGAAVATYGALQSASMLILASVAAGELGLVLITPALVGLVARLGRWLPLSPRLALRDTARNRASAAPAISAVMAAVAGSVAAGVILAGHSAQSAADYHPRLPPGYLTVQHFAGLDATPLDWTAAATAVRSVLPDARIHHYASPSCPSGSQDVMCGVSPVIPEEQLCPYASLERKLTPDEVRAAHKDDRCQLLRYGGGAIIADDGGFLPAVSDADPQRLAVAREVLARGGAVVSDPRLIKDGKATFEVYTDDQPLGNPKEPRNAPTLPPLTVEAHLVNELGGVWAIISPKALAAKGLGTHPSGLVAETAQMPTRAEEERINLLMRNLDANVYVYVERGPNDDEDPTAILIAIAAALIALGAAGIATGLAAADSRADLGTLAAVGAAPRLRRRLTLSQAGVISGVGAALGTLTGLGAAAVLVLAINTANEGQWMAVPPMPFLVPWDSVAVILAVPLLAMAGAGLLTRSRLPIERRM